MNPQDEDTEWNDILRQKGILPPKPPSAQMLLEKALDEAVEVHKLKQANPYEDCNLEELDELEEDDLDERIILEYKAKRLAELKEQLHREKFGEVFQISKPDFIREVTQASKDAPVIVHLFKDSILACRQLNQFLVQLAKKYKTTKFVKIIGDLCIENYPDRNLPTIIIYNNGEIVTQLVGLETSLSGGLTMKLTELENLLYSYQILGEALNTNHSTSNQLNEDAKKKTIRSSALSDNDEEDYCD